MRVDNTTVKCQRSLPFNFSLLRETGVLVTIYEIANEYRT